MLHWFTFIDPGSDFTTVVSLVSDFVSVKLLILLVLFYLFI